MLLCQAANMAEKEAAYIFHENWYAVQWASDPAIKALIIQQSRMFECIRVRFNNTFKIRVDLWVKS